MTAIVVDDEVIRALSLMRKYVDSLPQENLPDPNITHGFQFEWVDDVIRNNQSSTFAFEEEDEVELLNDVTEPDFGHYFKAGQRGQFDLLLDGISCVVWMDSALDDDTGGMGTVEVTCKLTDIKLVRKNDE